MFCCESESTLFGLPNEYTTRNQGLSYITTLFQNSTTQIFERVHSAHFTEDCFLDLGE